MSTTTQAALIKLLRLQVKNLTQFLQPKLEVFDV